MLEEAGIEKPGPRLAATPKDAARSAASPRPAKLGDRFAAFVLDSVFLSGGFAIVDAWIFMRFGKVEGAELSLTIASLLIVGTLNSLIFFTYGCLLEASVGATLGKALVGIRVVRTSQRSAIAASAIRNVLRVVDGFGLYLLGGVVAGCSRCRQRLGDLCAGTAVVEAEFGIAGKLCALLLWVGMAAGAVWAVPRICAENNVHQSPFLNQVVVRVGENGQAAYFQVAHLRFDVQIESNSGHSIQPANTR